MGQKQNENIKQFYIMKVKEDKNAVWLQLSRNKNKIKLLLNKRKIKINYLSFKPNQNIDFFEVSIVK